MPKVKMKNNPIEKKDGTAQGEGLPAGGETPRPLSPELTAQPITSDHAAPAKAEPQKKTKENTGSILKKTRESQGISLDVVHETTKIPLDALRAIEEGYTIRILSPFYYKGFVKMYADFLGLNASELLDNFTVEKLPEHITRDAEESRVVEWFNKTFTKKRKQKIVIGVGIALLIFVLFKLIAFVSRRKPAPPEPTVKTKVVKVKPIKKENPPKEAQKVSERPPREQVKLLSEEARPGKKEIVSAQEELNLSDGRQAPLPAPKPVLPQEPKAVARPDLQRVEAVNPPPTAIVDKEISLTVRANQNTWLRVKADENVVFQSILRAGAVETWFADKEIEISGRNINELEFELNGKMIGTLGRKDRDAKKVVITKGGLSVKQ
jgi:cytoskeleton protein RodZ